jgi:hypothetical protein
MYKSNESVSYNGSSSFLLAEIGSGDASDSVRRDIPSGEQSDTQARFTENAVAAADPSLFFELMSPVTSAKPDQMSASSLAYLGDVVFELFVRSRYVWPSRRMTDLQDKVVSVVRGKIHFTCITSINRLRSQKFTHTPPSTGMNAAKLRLNLCYYRSE